MMQSNFSPVREPRVKFSKPEENILMGAEIIEQGEGPSYNWAVTLQDGFTLSASYVKEANATHYVLSQAGKEDVWSVEGDKRGDKIYASILKKGGHGYLLTNKILRLQGHSFPDMSNFDHQSKEKGITFPNGYNLVFNNRVHSIFGTLKHNEEVVGMVDIPNTDSEVFPREIVRQIIEEGQAVAANTFAAALLEAVGVWDDQRFERIKVFQHFLHLDPGTIFTIRASNINTINTIPAVNQLSDDDLYFDATTGKQISRSRFNEKIGEFPLGEIIIWPWQGRNLVVWAKDNALNATINKDEAMNAEVVSKEVRKSLKSMFIAYINSGNVINGAVKRDLESIVKLIDKVQTEMELLDFAKLEFSEHIREVTPSEVLRKHVEEMYKLASGQTGYKPVTLSKRLRQSLTVLFTRAMYVHLPWINDENLNREAIASVLSHLPKIKTVDELFAYLSTVLDHHEIIALIKEAHFSRIRKEDSITILENEPNLNKKIVNTLKDAGFDFVTALLEKTFEEIQNLKGMGRMRAEILRAVLASHSLFLKDDFTNPLSKRINLLSDIRALPFKKPNRVLNQFLGVQTIAQLANKTMPELLSRRYVSDKTAEDIRQAFLQFGWYLDGDDPSLSDQSQLGTEDKATFGKLPAHSPGGIDLNASKLNLQKQGSGVDIKFNQAMIAQFKLGNFDGITPVITTITPIANIYPLLGLKEPASPSGPEGSMKLASV